MSVKFKSTDRRIVNNIAETRTNPRKKWYAIGTDGKKSYTTTIDNAMLIEARNEASRWAKSHGLRLEMVKVIK